MRGRSKVLSSFMAVALAVGLMPSSAFAADEGDAASGALMAGQVDFGDRAITGEDLQKNLEPQADEKGLEAQVMNHGAITFGKAYSNSFSSDTRHRYTFTLSTAGRVEIKGNVESYLFLTMYNAAGKNLRTFSYPNATLQKKGFGDFYYLNAGKYSVELSGQQNCNYSFVLSATKAGVTFEEKQGGFNNSIGTARQVNLGGTYKGIFSVDEQINYQITDYYKFVIPSERVVSISATSECGMGVSLRRSDADILKSVRAVFDQSKKCSVATITETLPAGQYYLCVTKDDAKATGGGAYTFSVSAPEPKQPMYRMFNPATGEHFYTASAAERDYLQYDPKGKWNYEGVHWSVPSQKNAYPVYRLCNPVTGDHHYTMDRNERNHVLNVLRWRDEGIGWYSEEPSKGTRIMRLNNPKLPAGAHHYTTNADEKRQCLKQGWKDEGYSWYVCK